jgi:peptide deformylase
MQIRLQDDPGLRQIAASVPKVTRRVAKLLRDMGDTMYAADGVGLAAPQIGVPQRLIVVDAGEGPLYLVNPEIHENEGSEIDKEGCLSVPDVYGYVKRYASVVVTGLDIRGRPKRIAATGLLARALQHEIDHLDGILFIDKATSVRQVTDE